jgi:hypothetical protein
MRLIAIASLMAGCAFAQKAESPLPATDAEKMRKRRAPVPRLSRKIRRCSTGLRRPMAKTGSPERYERMEPVFRAFPGIHTTNQDASTAYISVDERQYGRAGASH